MKSDVSRDPWFDRVEPVRFGCLVMEPDERVISRDREARKEFDRIVDDLYRGLPEKALEEKLKRVIAYIDDFFRFDAANKNGLVRICHLFGLSDWPSLEEGESAADELPVRLVRIIRRWSEDFLIPPGEIVINEESEDYLVLEKAVRDTGFYRLFAKSLFNALDSAVFMDFEPVRFRVIFFMVRLAGELECWISVFNPAKLYLSDVYRMKRVSADELFLFLKSIGKGYAETGADGVPRRFVRGPGSSKAAVFLGFIIRECAEYVRKHPGRRITMDDPEALAESFFYLKRGTVVPEDIGKRILRGIERFESIPEEKRAEVSAQVRYSLSGRVSTR